MSEIQLSKGPWKFYQHAIDDECGKGATFEKTNESVFVFKFPYLLQQVEVELKWNPSSKTLKGTYSWDLLAGGRASDNIEFDISENGNVLKGVPEGINGLRTWILASDQRTISKTDNQSYCSIS